VLWCCAFVDPEPRVNLDWRRLKAVVLESDDWGLCAWVPDEQAFRVLADTPAWRAPAGRIYGRSTLECADDVAQLVETLLEFRGGDGLPPVWQANQVMATPDFARLQPPLFECDTLPLVHYPEFPSRWQRPGLEEAIRDATDSGVWWPELHGLVHLPQAAWLQALRRGSADARRAYEHQCLVCQAVEASSEYDPTEPTALRTRTLTLAVDRFRASFGRSPGSMCAPDYRWDEQLEADAEKLGLTTLQGAAEQMGHSLPRLRHVLYRYRWPDVRGRRFYLPPRIAFEPRGAITRAARLGPMAAHRAARGAWGRGQPAIISSHRVNYAHIDPAWSENGRGALRDLLSLLTGDGAVFLTDAEVRSLHERGWSARAVGERGALLRYYGAPRARVRFPVPPGVDGVALPEGNTADDPRFTVIGGEVAAEVNPGEYLLEWRRG
jgi:hypothetical protein